MSTECNISVFTLNCWGIPVISHNRISRMCAIADVLASGKYDLVCLQEVWSEKDYFQIKQKVADILPYSHYFYSGVLGSGLCIFSKFPFYDVFFHHWPVNGYVHKVQHGDWFGGKGIGLCRLKINDITVNLYTAHLHAEYDRLNDEYLAHRVLQAFDTAQFIRLTSGSSDLVILGGDLNTEPGDLACRIICRNAQLEDAFLHACPVSKDCVGTNESCNNSYSNKQAVKLCSEGKRIDYVLFKTGHGVKVNKVLYELPLPNRVPDCNFSFSDHEAVSATISVSKTTDVGTILADQDSSEEHMFVLRESLVVCNQALVKLTKDQYCYWMISALLFMVIVSILSTSAPYDLHKIHKFVLSVVSVVMCFTIFMGSLWNRMEVNGILAGKLAMELAYAKLKTSRSDKEVTHAVEDGIH